jgi:hypothetical protein
MTIRVFFGGVLLGMTMGSTISLLVGREAATIQSP